METKTSLEDTYPPSLRSVQDPPTSRRSLEDKELYFVLSRGSAGLLDPCVLVSLDCVGGHSIHDEDIVRAWAAVRLRHSALASRIVFAQPKPEIVCASPLTRENALEDARATLRFREFGDRQEEDTTLLHHLLSVDPRHTLDVSAATAAVIFSRGVGSAAGQYALAMQFTHAVIDGRSNMEVVREILELVSQPTRADEELSAHFSRPIQSPKLPESVEALMPDLSGDEDQLQAAKEAFAELMKKSPTEKSGLVPDTTPNKGNHAPRILLQVWSPSETRRILDCCKSHGVTITHVGLAAMALASVLDVDEPQEGVARSSSEGRHQFSASTVVDLSHRLPSGGDNIMTRTGTIFLLFDSARSLGTKEEHTSALWDMAAQSMKHTIAFVDSPHFFQFLRLMRPLVMQSFQDRAAGKPRLPFLSSVGDCSHLLPTRYAISPGSEPTLLDAEDSQNEIRVVSMYNGAKPSEPSLQIYTYLGKLHMQMGNAASSCFSAAFIDSYFGRVLDMIALAAGLDAGGDVQEVTRLQSCSSCMMPPTA